MITHVVLVDVKEGADEAAVQKTVTEAKESLAKIEGVKRLTAGVAFRTNSNYKVGLCMYFENEQALDTYLEHPDHIAYVKQVFQPVATGYVTFDFHD